MSDEAKVLAIGRTPRRQLGGFLNAYTRSVRIRSLLAVWMIGSVPSFSASHPPISAAVDPLGVRPSQRLCAKTVVAARSDDFSPTAMRLFREGRTAGAIIAFYQFWRCPSRPEFNGLNPIVEDRDLLGPFDRAMIAGADGRYREGIEQLRAIVGKASYFLEARLMLGVFRYAEGAEPEAISTWKAALRADYFPVPPDFPKPHPVQSGLQELIHIVTARSEGRFTR